MAGWIEASGIRFKIASELTQDRVPGRLVAVSAAGWYGEGSAPAAPEPAVSGEIFSYRAPSRVLPDRYRTHMTGSVCGIAVRADRLRGMKKGSWIAVVLPNGHYELIHDNAWRHENGDLSWVGYVDGPGGRYRAVLTLGKGGVEGQIGTPGGVHALESDDAGEWLVDLNASGLNAGSLEGDEHPPACRRSVAAPEGAGPRGQERSGGSFRSPCPIRRHQPVTIGSHDPEVQGRPLGHAPRIPVTLRDASMKKFLIHGGLVTVSGLLVEPAALAANFTISGASTTAQTLNAGQTGTVTGTGSLTVSGGTVAVTMSGSSTLTNSGIIQQTGTGRAIRNNTAGVALAITNNHGALIQAADADAIQVNQDSSVTLDNHGSIISLNPSAAGSQAVDWNAIQTQANSLHNYSDGLLKAIAADAVRPGVNGVIVNDAGGVIQAIPVVDTAAAPTQATGSDGIDAQSNSGVEITNAGQIEGRHGITGGGSLPNFVITVTNQAGGTITGVNGSGINIDGATTSAAVVSHADIVNDGTIVGRWDSAHFTVGDGDGVDVDGTVTLTNNGIIRGLGAAGNGSDGLPNHPEGVAIGGGTIINNAGAEITGGALDGTGIEGHGILVDDSSGGAAFAATSITNGGLIRGTTGYAIRMVGSFANTVTNNAGGTIRGGGAVAVGAAIQTGGGDDTVINRGAVIGDNGLAMDLQGGDDTLIIEGGAASIVGDVSGGSGNNTLRFEIGAGNTFAYAGSFSNFADVRVDSGTVILSGASTYTGTTTVTGGMLRVENATGSATGSGPVEIAAGATLGGHGSIEGAVTVAGGGIISPGASVGTLDTGDITFAAGSIFAVELDPENSEGHGFADLLRVTGTVSLDYANLLLSLLSAPTAGQVFDILLNDGSDPIVGQFAQGYKVYGSYGGHRYAFTIDYGATGDGGAIGNDIRLTSVPEPGTGLLLGLGGLLLGSRRRYASRAG